MGLRTPLYETHAAAGARMVDFGGWDMPVNYGSQIEEHHGVRRDAGMFDVSHMCAVDLRGPRARDFVRRVLANDVAKLTLPGKALYSCMLREHGGVIDDLIAYYLDDAVVPGGRERRQSRQGLRVAAPACRRHSSLGRAALRPRHHRRAGTERPAEGRNAARSRPGVRAPWNSGQFFGAPAGDWFVARTGYTGEDGWEIMLPSGEAAGFWDRLRHAGVMPCGLGARDTLRLEAGMNLYGNDMDETVSPLECGLAWTIGWESQDRDFIGRAALVEQKARGVPRKQVGLVLSDRAVLRSHQKVIVPAVGEGEVTSGTFSPTLERSIGLARVPSQTTDRCEVEIRGRLLGATVVRPPFVRNGRIAIAL